MAGKPVAASPRCWCLCWCLWPTGVPGAASRRPSVFRAPEGPAAREARHPHFVRRRASKPARALRSLRRPPHQWGRVAIVWFGASARCPAKPRRRPRAPQPGQRGYRAPSNFARNSPMNISGFELASLELQRFRRLLNVHAIELRAKFLVGVSVLTHGHRSQAPQPGHWVPPAPSPPAAVGVLRHAKPSGGVSPACRRLGWRHSPRLVAARLRCLSSVPHSGVTVWWSARLIWVRSPCDPSRKLSTSDSK